MPADLKGNAIGISAETSDAEVRGDEEDSTYCVAIEVRPIHFGLRLPRCRSLIEEYLHEVIADCRAQKAAPAGSASTAARMLKVGYDCWREIGLSMGRLVSRGIRRLVEVDVTNYNEVLFPVQVRCCACVLLPVEGSIVMLGSHEEEATEHGTETFLTGGVEQGYSDDEKNEDERLNEVG